MSNAIQQEALQKAQSKEGQELIDKVLTAKTPVLATANDLVYKAYRRPYLGQSSGQVLVILASGYYYPTPQVHLYFEQVYGKFEFKLMQNNSSTFFYLATYHAAQWSSEAGFTSLPDTIVIEDAHGKHTVTVEDLS